MSQPTEIDGDLGSVEYNTSTPRHGFQGDRGHTPIRKQMPLGLSIALSREAGARGGTIARQVGQKMGWQVFDQELLEYMAQDSVVRQGLLDGLSEAAQEWKSQRMEDLNRTTDLTKDVGLQHMCEVILAIATQGDVVFIGRGAGQILPRSSTLNVRIIAPLGDRIAYMGQWLRLSTSEARDKVRLRDERRCQFLQNHFAKSPGEFHQYDLILNSTEFGENGCTELIVHAAKLRWERAVPFGENLAS